MVAEFIGSQIEEFESEMTRRGYGKVIEQAKEVIAEEFELDKEDKDLER